MCGYVASMVGFASPCLVLLYEQEPVSWGAGWLEVGLDHRHTPPGVVRVSRARDSPGVVRQV